MAKTERLEDHCSTLEEELGKACPLDVAGWRLWAPISGVLVRRTACYRDLAASLFLCTARAPGIRDPRIVAAQRETISMKCVYHPGYAVTLPARPSLPDFQIRDFEGNRASARGSSPASDFLGSGSHRPRFARAHPYARVPREARWPGIVGRGTAATRPAVVGGIVAAVAARHGRNTTRRTRRAHRGDRR